MICLRSYSYNAYTNGSEEYLWFFPGTFYIREVVPRSTGDVHTLVYSSGFQNGIRVVETAQEIEDKINAQKEQP